MPSVLIRLEPHRMKNPDADLRYLVVHRLAEVSNGVLRDNGYDYEDGTDAMLIYLSTHNVDAALPFVIGLLEGETIHDNRLADASPVGTSPLDKTQGAADFVVVYPGAKAGARMG